MTHEEASALVNNLTLEEKLKLKAFLDSLVQCRQKESRPGVANTEAAKVGKAIA